MKTEKFENKIKHLSQIEILSGAVSSLNQLLVDKGVISEAELQKYFQKWIHEHKSKKIDSMSLKDIENLEAKHTAFIGHGPHNTTITKRGRIKK